MISVENLAVQVGQHALRDIAFQVSAGQYAVLMGKTGCGKTTLLECLCGLRHVDAGKIRFGGRDVTHLKPAERGIGYVPQDGALFSTRTVREHLAFSLRTRRWPPDRIAQRTAELADMLSVDHLLDRRPKGLSGGEAQRVALGRALAFHPEILVLDEPLSALDDETRIQMYGLLKRVQQISGVTALHVTHSRQEARHLADQLLLFDDGKIVTVDDPLGELPDVEPAPRYDGQLSG